MTPPPDWRQQNENQFAQLPARDGLALSSNDTPDLAPPKGVAATPADPSSLSVASTATCDYFPTNSWSAQWSGVPASWRRNFIGAYDHYGVADLRSTSFFGGDAAGWYRAEIGHRVNITTPGFRSATVAFPWEYRGEFNLLSQFSPVPFAGGFSRASVDMRFFVDLRQNSISSALQVDRRRVAIGNGLPAEGLPIAGKGYASRQVATPAGALLTSAWRIEADLTTSTVAATNARAQFDFDSGQYGWFNGGPQRWVFELEPGYVLTTCG